MGNEGINRLARVLQGRMQELGNTPPYLDFGEIQSDMSLITNNFPLPIPQKDYIICKKVVWWTESNGGTHDSADGLKYCRLQPGDRVLVAWVGDDACVIDLILPATAIG